MSGDSYRWTRWSAPGYGPKYISVIEPPEDEDEKEKTPARKVPFGFSRALEPEPVERDPITWEGD